jgi:hypothetical protein
MANKTTFKEIFWFFIMIPIMVSIVAGIVVGIVQVNYEYSWFGGSSPPDTSATIVSSDKSDIAPANQVDTLTQLKQLHNPKAAVTVHLWLDSPGKTQFNASDKVTLYYQVYPNSVSSTKQLFYFTLLNLSFDDQLSIWLDNEPIETEKQYSLPKGQAALQSGQLVGSDVRLRLTHGPLYLRAIVTSEPVAWEKLEGDVVSQFQPMAVWATKSLPVIVN